MIWLINSSKSGASQLYLHLHSSEWAETQDRKKDGGPAPLPINGWKNPAHSESIKWKFGSMPVVRHYSKIYVILTVTLEDV